MRRISKLLVVYRQILSKIRHSGSTSSTQSRTLRTTEKKEEEENGRYRKEARTQGRRLHRHRRLDPPPRRRLARQCRTTRHENISCTLSGLGALALPH
jgi:hypothetical protein